MADSFFLGRGHSPALSKAAAKSARVPRELFDLGEILRRDKPRRDYPSATDASDIGKRKAGLLGVDTARPAENQIGQGAAREANYSTAANCSTKATTDGTSVFIQRNYGQ
jgi:hypothetical protein